jgi:hypothetical protein
MERHLVSNRRQKLHIVARIGSARRVAGVLGTGLLLACRLLEGGRLR